jgi:hypothetical protein
MVNVGIYIYTDSIADLSSVFVDNFISRVQADSGTFEAGNCLLTELQNLGGSLGETIQAKRIELFADEKISVTSSIQNINDISKTYTDFSQTFTVPATKNNNKIFKHWYENSLDTQFSTLIKADAYIELDTIPFRVGKIQLENCDIKNGQAQSYSITFIGNLGNLKDKFAGLFLKDLDSNFYDFNYSGTIVKDKVVTTAASADVMFPLISSNRYWNYGAGGVNDISLIANPIRYNELFPAIRLRAIFDLIDRDSKWNINFNDSFLSDARFTNAYLYLKNADAFSFKSDLLIDFATQTIPTTSPSFGKAMPYSSFNFTTEVLNLSYVSGYNHGDIVIRLSIQFAVSGKPYNVLIYKDGVLVNTTSKLTTTSVSTFDIYYLFTLDNLEWEGNYTFKIESNEIVTFSNSKLLVQFYEAITGLVYQTNYNQTVSQTTVSTISVKSYMPEIKIEDFFSGILKMFNLTCFSSDGVNYTIDTLENYYNLGGIIDLTKYIKTDSTNLTRVKTYKKINFLYEKSESLVNVGFNSNNAVEYGSLLYSTNADGEEYSIKLPFEDLNFNNLKDKFQVGYTLKTDLQKYVPKPIILYDYNPATLTALTDTTFYFSNATSGNGTAHTSYKAFGQELLTGGITYSLNFPAQQSTLTNEVIDNSLYQTYYSNYIGNIFNYRARLIKVSGILPTSLLTSLKLNDRVIIRDKRYIINSFTTDLTTGEASFELLTDLRTL